MDTTIVRNQFLGLTSTPTRIQRTHQADIKCYWTTRGCNRRLCVLIMAAQWNRTDHYIFILSFVLLLLSSSSFFPRLISAAADWMSAILPHMCGLSANLRCRSETCCTRLAETQDAKSRRKSASGHHRTNLLVYIFATKTHTDNRKKMLSSNMSSTCPQNMVNFGPIAAEIDPVV